MCGLPGRPEVNAASRRRLRPPRAVRRHAWGYLGVTGGRMRDVRIFRP